MIKVTFEVFKLLGNGSRAARNVFVCVCPARRRSSKLMIKFAQFTSNVGQTNVNRAAKRWPSKMINNSNTSNFGINDFYEKLATWSLGTERNFEDAEEASDSEIWSAKLWSWTARKLDFEVWKLDCEVRSWNMNLQEV